MNRRNATPKLLFIGLMALCIVSCDEDDDTKPSLRTSIDYSVITAETPYAETFKDASGNTTVDFMEGNQLLKMFQALNYQSTSSISANEPVDGTKLSNQYANTNNPFSDISTNTISVNGNELNNAAVNIKSKVASSRSASEIEEIHDYFEDLFEDIEEASASVNNTAAEGQAGKLGNFLVDDDGIEIAQVIQKSLIGALQLDYIGNVLMDEGLSAENHTVVSGKNYTQLEHNWDVAYGLLTLNPIYLEGSTNEVRGTVEFGAGSYLWEYNKANYANIYPAFLKGRAAIVNNDQAELEEQATFIRTQIEKAIASAALGYLGKWKSGETDAARAHAIGEGLGFIYSLRFAEIHQADAAFSEGILNELIESENGFWDLTSEKVSAAENAIKTKFNL